MGFPSCQFEASAKFMNMDWKLYLRNLQLSSKLAGKQKIRIYQDMERWIEKLKLPSSMSKF